MQIPLKNSLVTFCHHSVGLAPNLSGSAWLAGSVSVFVFEVDYSHLNAVRARIVELERLAQFRWSSYRAFGRGADERPAWLSCEDWLRTHGELADTPAGWLSY